MEVLHPTTIEEALWYSGDEETYFVAGGTLMQLDWVMGLRPARWLISLNRLPAMQGVEMVAGGIRIGPLTTLSMLERCPEIAGLPLLLAAVQVTASPAVRNRGTIGGNIAGRRGCLIPALLALDAQLEVARTGVRQRVSLFDWLQTAREPGCLVEAVFIPSPKPIARSTYRKIGYRAAFTPAVIDVAGLISVDAGRIVHCRLAVGGGVAAARLYEVEAKVAGQSLDDIDWSDIHGEIVEAIKAPTDYFRSGRYRRVAAANALVYGLGEVLPKLNELPKRRPHQRRPGLSDEIVLGRRASGKDWHVRPDAPAKVAGRLTYLTDVREKEMLVGRILRSPVPHARLIDIDTTQAEQLPGIVGVVTHRDIKGTNGFGIVVQDQPAMCLDKVRYIGDAVAAVAAIDQETAARALSLIKLTYEELPIVDDPERALSCGAEAVHAKGNLQCEIHFSRGNAAAAFAGAAHVVEATYVTPRQMHSFMETEGGYAFVDEDGTLNVCAGGQHGRRDQMQLSRLLGIPEERIRVVSSPTGGAFGGKDELTVQPALALLALKTGRPVRMQLERMESVVAGTKSSPMRIRMRTACDDQGRLLAQEVDLLADAGAYASLSPGVVETALEHACGPYEVPNVQTRARLAYTNNGTCGALRGFGCNQMSYALECQIDRLASACGPDSLEFRARNLRKPGTVGYLGQAVAPTERLKEMLDAAAADPIWDLPSGLSADGTEILGVGMGMNYQGNGLGTLPPDPGGGELRLAVDGVIEAAFGLDEIGQGLQAAIRNTVAREMGCGHADIRPVTGDTATSPESGSTTASRGTFVVWRVARDAGPALAAELVAIAARLLGRDPDSLTIAPGGVVERTSNSGDLLMTFADIAKSVSPQDLPRAATAFEFPKSDYFEGNARLIFAFGATLARVAVNRITGAVRVLDISQHTAAGPVLDHAAYLGQIEGASVQGVGFTLTEDALLNRGLYVTENFDFYVIPSVQDAPQSMSVFALESLDREDAFGPRGIGELGIGAITPAIANAVADATGRWPEQVPINPEWVLSHLAGVS
ncbi:molybdopterin cofactor-binding domain-containing protein [Mesorhizobium sp. BAC0120]|uniref:molybdopterin cofactor-binding domain-containing protein n=1 Tax=Mesorhizobium sp. BAC0120 TaxID=3090670 RepID=UPI00298BCDBC|nr:molybdopterin cofactor-binding domain-containing protein [Mesorhizobium sp. BAC0120]MDW6023189.1 molybdopterin cofactor-binding domain-containing protein [Mesorhizobium sp. BAC0120]